MGSNYRGMYFDNMYSELKGPMIYRIYSYNDETKEYEFLRKFETDLAANIDGYKVVAYGKLLVEMEYSVEKIFKDVNKFMIDFGDKIVISRNYKSLNEYFKSYQDLETFMTENYPTNGLSEECYDAISIDPTILISGYNNYQEKINEDAIKQYRGSSKYRIDEGEVEFTQVANII